MLQVAWLPSCVQTKGKSTANQVSGAQVQTFTPVATQAPTMNARPEKQNSTHQCPILQTQCEQLLAFSYFTAI